MKRARPRPRSTTRPPRDPVSAYARDVMEGRVVAGHPVQLACARHLADLKEGKARGLRWNLERALVAIRFFRDMLVMEDGRPFKLEPFQCFIVGSVFGWHGPDGNRRFRTAYVEAGKGNGKTPLAAGIGLYALIADDQPAPEVYSAATTRDQAKICWLDADGFVERDPELSDLVDRQVGSLAVLGTRGVFRPVSAEHKGLDGKRVHCALIDELHEHPTPLVVDKIRAGTKNRMNALIFEITNSGHDRTSVCWHHHEYSLKLLEGSLQNDAWFAFVCSLDEGDSWTDEAVWPKANPGLETIVPRAYLRDQVTEALGMPSKENIVRRLNFCEWTETADRWLDMGLWDACPSEPPVTLETFAGRDVMAGLDGASVQDIFAFALVAGPDEDGFYDALCRFWIPEKTLAAQESGRAEADRLRLQEWARRGWIRTTSGDTTDYDVVEADILELLAQVRLRRLSFDRWNVTQLVTHLKAALGNERVVDFGQTMAMMSAPSKELEKIVRDGKLRHGGNPVLRWMASNAALAYGPNEQVRPDRQRSGDKIDGLVALIMGIDGTMRAQRPANSSFTVIPCG